MLAAPTSRPQFPPRYAPPRAQHSLIVILMRYTLIRYTYTQLAQMSNAAPAPAQDSLKVISRYPHVSMFCLFAWNSTGRTRVVRRDCDRVAKLSRIRILLFLPNIDIAASQLPLYF